MEKLFITICLILITLSCSHEITVFTDYDRDFNLELYHTYNWATVDNIEVRNNPLYYNELNDKRIKLAVDQKLISKGYSQSENAEVIIHYHIVIDDKSVVATDPFGYHYSPYWIRSRRSVYLYSEGSLIIDVMDATNKHLIWRGWAVTPLENYRNGEKVDRLINDSVKKIFREFPIAGPVKKEEPNALKI